MKIERIHHVAYRCRDAKETVEWYRKHLGMDFVLAIAEDQVPSTHAPDPYMHLFMDAGNGNVLAFFELPNSPPMGRDSNTPDWVQHIAFKVGSVAGAGRHQGAAGGGGHRRGRRHRPHHLQVDLLLRPQRPPAGTGRDTGTPDMYKQARRREVGDARRVVADQARAQACALDARGRTRGLEIADVEEPTPTPSSPTAKARRSARAASNATRWSSIGAGPIGLSAALDCAQRGIPVLLLDDNNTVSIGSRAVCYAKRPLEIWDRLGVAEPLVAKGVRWHVGKVFLDDELVYRFDLLPESRPQDAGDDQPAAVLPGETLVDGLRGATRVVDLRWKHKLVALQQQADHARLTVRNARRPLRPAGRLGDRLRRRQQRHARAWSGRTSRASSSRTAS